MLGVLQPRVSADLARLEEEVVACRRCPRLVAWREQVAREKRASFADEEYWGRPVPGFGDPAARVARPRPGARGPRRQPHRPRLHRRPLGRLAVRRAAPRRLRQPADVGAAATTACGCTARGSSAAVRCAPPANKPTPAGARHLPAVDGGRARAARATCAWSSASAPSPGTRRCGCAPRSGHPRPRPRPRFGHGGGVRRRRVAGAARLLSPQPAEHVHRAAHRADARRRASAVRASSPEIG